MQGYDNTSYGEGFAEVYDEWYADITDVSSTVEALAALAMAAGPAPVVELGVGTGRIAIPLAKRLQPLPVWGIDASKAMLTHLDGKHPPSNLHVVLGDMATDLGAVCPGERIGVVFAAFNTFFGLTTTARQQECLHVIAGRLTPTGCFVVEAFVPDEPARRGDHIEVKSLQADRVVLSISRHDGEQQVQGQFVEFTETGGVRLRPWSIRYASPAGLDGMAAAAGLQLRDRWENFAGANFTDESPRHVSVYARADAVTC